MRIVGGTLRGRRLATPDSARVRPTGERVREALFNILSHGIVGFEIAGTRVLDLFAGTGALGLEALSRGAEFCVFVDDHVDSRAVVRRNLEAFDCMGRAKLFRRDATRLGDAGRHGSFDLIFADPPYGNRLGEKAIMSAADGGWINDGAVIVLEESIDAEVEFADGFGLIDERRYGDTRIAILQKR